MKCKKNVQGMAELCHGQAVPFVSNKPFLSSPLDMAVKLFKLSINSRPGTGWCRTAIIAALAFALQMIDEEHIPIFLRDHKTKVDCTSFNCSFHQSFWAHLQEQAASATPDSEEAPAAPDEAHVEAPRRRSRLHIGSKRRVSEEEKKASDISAIAPDPDQGRH